MYVFPCEVTNHIFSKNLFACINSIAMMFHTKVASKILNISAPNMDDVT